MDALLRAVSLAFPAPCSRCGGAGEVEHRACTRCISRGHDPCPACFGVGERPRWGAPNDAGMRPHEVAACWMCGGSKDLSLLAPGVCTNCGQPSERHKWEKMPGWHMPGGERLSHWTPMSHDEERFDHFYEERPGPLSSPWPRRAQ